MINTSGHRIGTAEVESVTSYNSCGSITLNVEHLTCTKCTERVEVFVLNVQVESAIVLHPNVNR